MPLLRIILLTTLFGMSFISRIEAQISNVNSKIKIVGGEAFYIHTVLESQALDQIAQAYFTSVEEITRYNPKQVAPLIPGVKLKIPYSDESLEAMSKMESKPSQVSQPQKVVRVESPKPEVLKEVKPEEPELQEQPTPIEEALTLIEDPIGEEEENEIETEAEVKVEEPLKIEETEELKNTSAEVIEEKPEPDTAAPTVTANDEAEIPAAVMPRMGDDAVVHSEVDTSETQHTLSELTDLANNISESLANLAKIQEALEPSPIDPNTGDLLEDPSEKLPEEVLMASELLNQQIVNFYDTASENTFHLKEYFILDLNATRRILKAKDERTVTNSNSHYLNLAELHGVKIDSLSMLNQRLPIGFHVEMKRYDYKVKVKKKKVRVYKTQAYVEHFEKGHPHEKLILDAARNAEVKGKGYVSVLDGAKEIAAYKKFEYNPFGTKMKSVYNDKVLRIEKMDF